jgi:hypothetical protein
VVTEGRVPHDSLAERAGAAVTTQDLARFAEVFADLDDPAVMSQAWR